MSVVHIYYMYTSCAYLICRHCMLHMTNNLQVNEGYLFKGCCKICYWSHSRTRPHVSFRQRCFPSLAFSFFCCNVFVETARTKQSEQWWIINYCSWWWIMMMVINDWERAFKTCWGWSMMYRFLLIVDQTILRPTVFD